jgi:hypothetical protein
MQHEERVRNILENIRYLASENLISKDELISAYEAGARNEAVATVPGGSKEEHEKRSRFSEILYGIGGLIVIIGIVTLVFQNWRSLNDVAKILITLGSGIAAYMIGIIFGRHPSLEKVSQVFHIISTAVMPVGLFITFNIVGVDISNKSFQVVIPGILSILHILTLKLMRQKIFVITSILYSTWLYFALIYILSNSIAFFDTEKIYMYAVMLAGIAYVLIGYSFSTTENRIFTNYLYAFGPLFFLGGGFALTASSRNVLWELIFPFFVFGVIFLSIKFKSRAFLIWGSLFLMAYIIRLTAEYFANTIGWPFALVIAGLALIAVGRFSYGLNKRYIKIPGLK